MEDYLGSLYYLWEGLYGILSWFFIYFVGGPIWKGRLQTCTHVVIRIGKLSCYYWVRILIVMSALYQNVKIRLVVVVVNR